MPAVTTNLVSLHFSVFSEIIIYSIRNDKIYVRREWMITALSKHIIMEQSVGNRHCRRVYEEWLQTAYQDLDHAASQTLLSLNMNVLIKIAQLGNRQACYFQRHCYRVFAISLAYFEVPWLAVIVSTQYPTPRQVRSEGHRTRRGSSH